MISLPSCWFRFSLLAGPGPIYGPGFFIDLTKLEGLIGKPYDTMTYSRINMISIKTNHMAEFEYALSERIFDINGLLVEAYTYRYEHLIDPTINQLHQTYHLYVVDDRK